MSGLGFSNFLTKEAGSEESGRTMMAERSFLLPLNEEDECEFHRS